MGGAGTVFFGIKTIQYWCCTTVDTEKLFSKFRRHPSIIMDFKTLGDFS